MKEPWTIAHRDCALRRVAQLCSEFLKLPINRRGLFDVVQERDVIAGLDRREVCSQHFGYRRVIAILSPVDRQTLVSRELGAFFKPSAPLERS